MDVIDDAAAKARAWLDRQKAGPDEDLLDEGDCRLCGAPSGEPHEPTDPCGIVEALLVTLKGGDETR